MNARLSGRKSGDDGWGGMAAIAGGDNRYATGMQAVTDDSP
ncbi:MAG: hypothetical protein O3C67_11210 [Cyanobacteria bacterium]|nr:hypothetical protein [Cyanobacteriota bacterium]